jgi:hypothetical protein
MPRVTILVPENHVYIDGVSRTVDCAGIADSEAPGVSVHAVHWNGATGWIEYVNDPFDTVHHVHNRRIADISQFQKFVDAGNAATPHR